MKIEAKDYDRIMKGLDKMKVNSKKILDLPKYMYWSAKSEEYIEAMNNDRSNKPLFFENWRQSLLCEFEKNKYQYITRKEWLMLLMMLKTFNMNQKDNKLFMNKRGFKAERGAFE